MTMRRGISRCELNIGSAMLTMYEVADDRPP